jgi:hypothetical protein
MDYSYESIYRNYVSFCDRLALPHLSFENWMKVRDSKVHTPYDDIKAFLDSRAADGGLNSKEEVQKETTSAIF